MKMTHQEVKLTDVIKLLDKAISGICEIFDGISNEDLPNLLKYYRALDEHQEKLAGSIKILNLLHHELQYERIPAAMEAQKFDSLRTAGRLFYITGRVSASIKDREKARKFLTEQGYVWEDMATINSQTLSSIVKTMIEERAIEPSETDDGIKHSKVRYVAMRKS